MSTGPHRCSGGPSCRGTAARTGRRWRLCARGSGLSWGSLGCCRLWLDWMGGWGGVDGGWRGAGVGLPYCSDEQTNPAGATHPARWQCSWRWGMNRSRCCSFHGTRSPACMTGSVRCGRSGRWALGASSACGGGGELCRRWAVGWRGGGGKQRVCLRDGQSGKRIDGACLFMVNGRMTERCPSRLKARTPACRGSSCSKQWRAHLVRARGRLGLIGVSTNLPRAASALQRGQVEADRPVAGADHEPVGPDPLELGDLCPVLTQPAAVIVLVLFGTLSGVGVLVFGARRRAGAQPGAGVGRPVCGAALARIGVGCDGICCAEESCGQKDHRHARG